MALQEMQFISYTQNRQLCQRNCKSSWIGCLERNPSHQCPEMEEHSDAKPLNIGIYGLCRLKSRTAGMSCILMVFIWEEKACILICCDDKYVLGWYLCRYEYAAAWTALMKRIAEPRMVVSDGGTGFAKALKKYGRVQNTKDAFSMYSAR